VGLGSSFAFALAYLFVAKTPCEANLTHFKNSIQSRSIAIDRGFERSRSPQQRRILKAFGLEQYPHLDATFWTGFWFLQNKIGIHRIGVSLLQQRREQLDREKLGRREKLFRIHPGALVPLCRSIGILYEHALRSPHFNLQKLQDALNRIQSEVESKRRIKFNNGILGYFEEIRAAAYLAEQGYTLHEISRGETTSQSKDFEIDIVVSKPGSNELILVEVKSTLLSTWRSRTQFNRYSKLLNGEVRAEHDYARGILFLTKELVDKETALKFLKSNPNFEIMSFPEGLLTPDVYPIDEF